MPRDTLPPIGSSRSRRSLSSNSLRRLAMPVSASVVASSRLCSSSACLSPERASARVRARIERESANENASRTMSASATETRMARLAAVSAWR